MGPKISPEVNNNKKMSTRKSIDVPSTGWRRCSWIVFLQNKEIFCFVRAKTTQEGQKKLGILTMWNRVRPSGIHVLMTLDQDGCKFCLNHLVFVLIVFIACYPVGGFSSFFFWFSWHILLLVQANTNRLWFIPNIFGIKMNIPLGYMHNLELLGLFKYFPP